jgi:Ca2+-binding RTX toxin-like protein
MAISRGTANNDTLTGTVGNDQIYGDDYIYGGNGSDSTEDRELGLS